MNVHDKALPNLTGRSDGLGRWLSVFTITMALDFGSA